MPKLAIALAVVITVVSSVNYLTAGRGHRDLVVTRAAEKPVTQVQSNEIAKAVNPAPLVPTDNKQLPVTAASPESPVAPRALAAAPAPVSPVVRAAPDATGPVYFCGAETKKGTPCSRKVKGNVRCWQHAGMPAMLPADKLLVSR